MLGATGQVYVHARCACVCVYVMIAANPDYQIKVDLLWE